jgi:hypothetical protein
LKGYVLTSQKLTDDFKGYECPYLNLKGFAFLWLSELDEAISANNHG